MKLARTLFTSESVTEGHSDKVADRISNLQLKKDYDELLNLLEESK